MLPEKNLTIGLPFLQFQSLDSTNNYAMALVREGVAHHGTAVFAHEQTSGKGQRNKKWFSRPGENITISIIVDPLVLNKPTQFLLNMAIALGVYEFIASYAGDETKIKWPNDIFWRDRKAAGILIENIIKGVEWKFSIVGIGINVNQTSFHEEINFKAVSLKQITGEHIDVIKLSKELCSYLQVQLNQLTESTDTIYNNYQKHLYKLNESVRLKHINKTFVTTIKGVSSTGELITSNAVEQLFTAGDVEWL